MLSEQLQKKVDRALKLLQSVAPTDGSPVEVAYSGGKDSDVILQLVKESGIAYRAIYRNTTIDPSGTTKHAKDKGVEVKMPKQSFFQLVEKKGYPSRFVRFCCSELKEYKILDKCVMGVRKDESKARTERYNEPTQCRFYGNKRDHVEAIYPILEWTAEDVAEFVADRGIQCHPLYYDEQGEFHAERRLGCIGCPLAYKKKRLAEFKQYPKMVRAWLKAGQKYLDSHRHTKNGQQYETAYEFFYRTVFFDSNKEYEEFNSGLFGKPDYKSLLEEQFGIDLTIKQVTP